MFGLFGFFPAWVQWSILGALAAAAGAAVLTYNNAIKRAASYKSEVSRLETDLGRMRSVEATLRENLKLKDATIKALDEHKAAFGANLEEACALYEKSKDSETPVDDVLEALKEKNRE